MHDTGDDPAEAQRRTAADPRSNEELLKTALRHWDDDEADAATDALGVLAARAGRDELSIAMELSQAPPFQQREMGAWVLGRIGNINEPAFYDETVDRLVEMLDDENTSVVSAAIYALGQRTADQAIGRLEAMSRDERTDVREAIAYALGMMSDASATRTLMRLTEDSEVAVRDWATFGLGTLHEDVDSPDIRATLTARATDHDAEVRGEALIGLARRRDPRTADLIRAELERDTILGDWPFEAAELLGDRKLLPDLQRVWERFAEEENPRLSTALANAMAALKRG